MLFSHGYVQTSELIDKVMGSVENACDDIGVEIKSVDKSNYQLMGKSWIKRRSVISIKFHIVLHGNENGTIIEIYDEYYGFRGPDKNLIEPFFKSLAKEIPFTTSYAIDKANRDKTKDGLIIIDNVPEILPQVKSAENFDKMEYEVEPVGKYTNN
jgi:hypothetical protein